ncbi:MAG: hypothetical protein NT085_05255 [candidate division SR1 bacterium]|nr:hypothetical protein [candidate division SR1 bacterium]
MKNKIFIIMIIIIIAGCNNVQQPQLKKMMNITVVWPKFALNNLGDGGANSPGGEYWLRYTEAESIDFPYKDKAKVNDTVQLKCVMHNYGEMISWEVVSIKGPYIERVHGDGETQVEEMRGIITSIHEDTIHADTKK